MTRETFAKIVFRLVTAIFNWYDSREIAAVWIEIALPTYNAAETVTSALLLLLPKPYNLIWFDSMGIFAVKIKLNSQAWRVKQLEAATYSSWWPTSTVADFNWINRSGFVTMHSSVEITPPTRESWNKRTHSFHLEKCSYHRIHFQVSPCSLNKSKNGIANLWNSW